MSPARAGRMEEGSAGPWLCALPQTIKAMPSSEMLPWLIAAFADMHLQTKEPAYAEFVFEMSDWAAKLQYEGTDRLHVDWRGGFPTVVNGKIVAVRPPWTPPISRWVCPMHAECSGKWNSPTLPATTAIEPF